MVAPAQMTLAAVVAEAVVAAVAAAADPPIYADQTATLVPLNRLRQLHQRGLQAV